MSNRLFINGLMGLCCGVMLFGAAQVWAGGSPEVPLIGERKVLTLVVREPPALRCNNNMQVAAELSNLYKLPVVVLPASLAPWSNAPAVYYGDQLVAEDGGDFNGMVGFGQVQDILEIEAVPKQDRPGRLMEVKKIHDSLKAAIKGEK